MNAQLLKYHIAKNGYKAGEFAGKLKMSYSSFSNKINSKTAFTIVEANEIINLLNISKEEALSIFFDK